MEKKLYEEMNNNLKDINNKVKLSDKKIFVFGHCNASFELVDLLEAYNLKVAAILDNSDMKQGQQYKGAMVVYPSQIIKLAGTNPQDESIVLITSRFYASMLKQLREIGYEGPVRKLIDYNTYAEYSLSADTIARMTEREKQGEVLLKELSDKYPGYFKTFCPFNALGDVYIMMSYWSAFAKVRNIKNVVFCAPSSTLADVIHMFGNYSAEVYEQKKLDSMIQAAMYTKDNNSFIAHQDRPYVINLHKALYIKKIPLEQIYCCGVFGLSKDTKADIPANCNYVYKDIDSIPESRAVIFSPYAKSVVAIDSNIWKAAVKYYNNAGYKCYTNVVGDELPLENTEAISPSILEIKSVVERAGIFIGIRSGLCDVIREAKAKKIALYPDYNYCDTKWKAIDIYWIKQFDYNLPVTQDINWEEI